MNGRQHIVRWVLQLFSRGAALDKVTPSKLAADVAVVPLQLPAWAAWADEVVPAARPTRAPSWARPLSAQLASQARLNVPKSRKRTGTVASTKPKRVSAAAASAVVAKKGPTARSVHLQARHLVPSRPAVVVDRPNAALASYAGPRGLDLAA